LLWNRSDSNDETPPDTSSTASTTTTSNSGKSYHQKSYSSGSVNKKLKPPIEKIPAQQSSNDQVNNRSLSDDNFPELPTVIEQRTKKSPSHALINTSPEIQQRQISPVTRGSQSMTQLINTNPQRKQASPLINRFRRHSDLKLLSPTNSPPTRKPPRPLIDLRSTDTKKQNLAHIFDQSDELSLISDEEIKTEVTNENILRTSSEESPDLLTISD